LIDKPFEPRRTFGSKYILNRMKNPNLSDEERFELVKEFNAKNMENFLYKVMPHIKDVGFSR
jgi:hypothetical protein